MRGRSGRRGRGGWTPETGLRSMSPHRTAWAKAWARTRCRLRTVPPDTGQGVQPDEALVAVVGLGPDPSPDVGEPPGEVLPGGGLCDGRVWGHRSRMLASIPEHNQREDGACGGLFSRPQAKRSGAYAQSSGT